MFFINHDSHYSELHAKYKLVVLSIC